MRRRWAYTFYQWPVRSKAQWEKIIVKRLIQSGKTATQDLQPRWGYNSRTENSGRAENKTKTRIGLTLTTHRDQIEEEVEANVMVSRASGWGRAAEPEIANPENKRVPWENQRDDTTIGWNGVRHLKKDRYTPRVVHERTQRRGRVSVSNIVLR